MAVGSSLRRLVLNWQRLSAPCVALGLCCSGAPPLPQNSVLNHWTAMGHKSGRLQAPEVFRDRCPNARSPFGRASTMFGGKFGNPIHK